MFQKINVNILNIIEKMSIFASDDGKEHFFIFGKDGAKNLSKNLNNDLLVSIQIEIGLGEGADYGSPLTVFFEKSPTEKNIINIAKRLSEKTK